MEADDSRTEKTPPRLRRLTQLLPAVWVTMLAGGVIMPWDVSTAGSLLAFIAAALAGGAAGRFVWNRISARSRARVERLAAALSRHAYDTSKKGLVVPDEKSES
jgi:hypothetical protein